MVHSSATPLGKSFRDNPSVKSKNQRIEAKKISILLSLDSLVNLSLADRLALSSHFEWDTYNTVAYLSLKHLVPKYAIKANSMLIKSNNSFIQQNQLKHAQKLYEKISRDYNSFPYGILESYEFEPWNDNTYRCNIRVKYRASDF